MRYRVQLRRFLDDVFEAESAVAGEPLAFASAAQVLSVGPFGVDVALRYCTGTACFVASLKKERRGLGLVVARGPFFKFTQLRAYVTCDVLNTVWVEVLLAFPTVLFEVNLEHTILQLGQVSHTVALMLCHGPFITNLYFGPPKYKFYSRTPSENYT